MKIPFLLLLNEHPFTSMIEIQPFHYISPGEFHITKVAKWYWKTHSKRYKKT